MSASGSDASPDGTSASAGTSEAGGGTPAAAGAAARTRDDAVDERSAATAVGMLEGSDRRPRDWGHDVLGLCTAAGASVEAGGVCADVACSAGIVAER